MLWYSNTSVFSYCPVLQLCIPLCLKCCFSSSLVKPRPLLNTQFALIGQLTHAWPSTGNNNNRAAVPNLLLNVKLATRHTLSKCVTWQQLGCHTVTELKMGLLTRCFRSSVSRRREELQSVWALTCLTFTWIRTYIRLKEMKKMKKHYRCPLT